LRDVHDPEKLVGQVALVDQLVPFADGVDIAARADHLEKIEFVRPPSRR
jgi:hypothetical protein